MFCLNCGNEEKLYDGLCKKCYLDEFKLVKVPEHATFTVCAHCGSTLRQDKWIQSSYHDDEIINDAIQKDLIINDKLENPEIQTEILVNRGTVYECKIHITGDILDTTLKNSYDIEVKVEKSVCPDCSKFHSGYYESVLQLRADNRKLLPEEITEADEFISKEIQHLCKTNKLAYVTERIVLKEGLDYQIGSYNACHRIVINMQKQFGGIITESRKIVGHDKSRSKDLYRSWVSIRLPSFHKNDFITYQEDLYEVLTIGSHKIIVYNLDINKQESISWKEYENIKKVATTQDIKNTTITSISPDTIQFLDPDSFVPIDFKKSENMNKLNIGQEVPVIKIDQKVRLLLKDKT